MSKDFGAWLNNQGKAKEAEKAAEDGFCLECRCGKYEYVTMEAFENGDTGWFSENPESGKGLCGGQWCMP
jgi:hypothetical protein